MLYDTNECAHKNCCGCVGGGGYDDVFCTFSSYLGMAKVLNDKLAPKITIFWIHSSQPMGPQVRVTEYIVFLIFSALCTRHFLLDFKCSLSQCSSNRSSCCRPILLSGLPLIGFCVLLNFFFFFSAVSMLLFSIVAMFYLSSWSREIYHTGVNFGLIWVELRSDKCATATLRH